MRGSLHTICKTINNDYQVMSTEDMAVYCNCGPPTWSGCSLPWVRPFPSGRTVDTCVKLIQSQTLDSLFHANSHNLYFSWVKKELTRLHSHTIHQDQNLNITSNLSATQAKTLPSCGLFCFVSLRADLIYFRFILCDFYS